MADTEHLFRLWPLKHGLLQDLADDEFPARISGWQGRPLALCDDATHFGFVADGPAHLETGSGTFKISARMYFAAPGRSRLVGGSGIVISRLNYRGVFHLGGPIEQAGRLRYIDGCQDSLLIPPVVRGDPCLNLLQILPHTDQTAHTHPSLRAGLIVQGSGECVTDAGATLLSPNDAFLIPADYEHRFRTADSSLLVVAWHPDSDFGPTDEDHPMLNRTIIDGVSAALGGRKAEAP